jgi:prepilin-type N-terminal cleavage/methylation domain-containing protein
MMWVSKVLLFTDLPKKMGFTLIELLVVMAIMSVLMGLVGPLTINGLEKAQARTEVMTLTRWLDDLAYRAFLSQQNINLQLKGKQVTASSPEVGFVKYVDFEYLYFQPQNLVFNTNGFTQQQHIQYQHNEETLSIVLQRSLSVH